MGDQVVGRGTSTNSFVPDQAAVDMIKSDMMSAIDGKLASKKIILTNTNGSNISLVDSFNESQLTNIGKVLKKKGYSVKASGADVKNLLATDPVLLKFASESKNYDDLYAKMIGDYLPSLDTSAGGNNLPTRQIYQYSDDDIKTIVDESYMNSVGRKATPEEVAARLASVRTDLSVGTLTTTKKIKNPKTGVLETVVKQEAGPTKTSIQTGLEADIKAAAPQEVDIKQRGEFANWLSQNAAGA